MTSILESPACAPVDGISQSRAVRAQGAGAIWAQGAGAIWAQGAIASLVRLGVAGAAGFALAHLTLPGRPATLCPFRALTGIPCPVCGSTTAAVELGHFNVIAALQANPFAIVAGIAVILAPLALAARAAASMSAGVSVGGSRQSVSPRTKRWLMAACVAAVLLSETWQLFRFHII